MNESNTLKRPKNKKQLANGSSCSSLPQSDSLKFKLEDKKERQRIVLWRRPLLTLQYFILESLILSHEYLSKLWTYKRSVVINLLLLGGIYFASITEGPHQHLLQIINHKLWWCLWWIWLGILSSVGLGTGLHTFLLYLGPFIASVTIAAYSCHSVDFPEPPYPDEIHCPDETDETQLMDIWIIMSKVRLEAFMWGAGTAIGELPPYFMARGARLSGTETDDEELAEFEELQRLAEHPDEMSWLDRTKLSIEKLVEKVGFFGILACASIPNPLFDLAGITCGHFLVPFWTFFGATLIGKAVVKMHIQKIFVIVAFNETLISKALELLKRVPVIGRMLEKPFEDFLESQKHKLRTKVGKSDSQGAASMVSWLFEKFVLGMILYFVVSLVNSFAQSYHKRLSQQQAKVGKKKHAVD